MKTTTIVLFTLLSFSLISSCRQKEVESRLIPIEDFFRNPDRSVMLLSPDGEKIAYVKNYKNRSNIFVEDLQSGAVRQITFDTLRGINRYIWLSDNRILYLFDRDGSENYHLYSTSLDGKSSVDLTPFDGVKMRLFDLSNVKGDEILIALNKRNPEVFDLYRLNTKTGALRMLQENQTNISFWKEDLKGDIRIAMATDGVNEKILYKKSMKDSFQVLMTIPYDETFYPIRFCDDGKSIYAISNVKRDKTALVIFDLELAKEREVLFEHDEVDLGEAEISDISNLPMYVSYTAAKVELKYFNQGLKNSEQLIRKEIGEDSYTIVNHDNAENRFLIKAYSDRNIGTYYLLDVEREKVQKICDLSPWLEEEELCEMKSFRFNARDGLSIEAYLTLPNTKKDQYPIIVYPHGGPWSRNSWRFSPEVQFLANRGYAVLQVNYRGSEGYGKQFSKAGFKEIGRKMQYDITDGLYHLIAKGVVDTSAIGIYGFSFGGYFALNGLIQDSGLYKCGASYCGLPSLYSYIKEVPPYQKQYLQMLYEMIGNPEKDAAYFRAYSPVFHTEKISVPVFIAQGENDTRISVEDVNVFVRNLERQGSDVTYMLVKGEGHGFQNEENRFMLYRELEQFFSKNLQK